MFQYHFRSKKDKKKLNYTEQNYSAVHSSPSPGNDSSLSALDSFVRSLRQSDAPAPHQEFHRECFRCERAVKPPPHPTTHYRLIGIC